MKYIALALCMALLASGVNAQIIINEASNRNYTQLFDKEGETHDWFELYNAGTSDVNLNGYGISDKIQKIGKWSFQNYVLGAGQYVVLFASGLNIHEAVSIHHWESAVLPSDDFKYMVPDAATPANWNTLAFNAGSWPTGKAGFGFGDWDDNTEVSPSSAAVYIRKEFSIPDTSVIASALLHIDYDDGFVAYLNGTEICRSNIAGSPSWNSLANGRHEAQMYLGKDPEKYYLNMELIRDIWTQGNNLLAIEVHNSELTSDDMSLIPYLSFGLVTSNTYFQSTPGWFSNSTEYYFHTNFKIDPDGETLYLSSPEGSLLDSLAIPRTPLNASFGRITDGSSATGIFTQATPGWNNSTSQAFTNGQEPEPEFSVAAGFFSSGVSVSLSSTSATSTIRYTTDGSEPTTSSGLYSSPLYISSTTTLKAKCFSSINKLPSNSNAATYFINASHVLPVISISTDNENLYGSTGIFDNTDEDWNKPCYIEYFNENQELVYKQAAGLQLDGGAGGSRTHPQHSVRVEPGNGSLGDGDVKYVMIPDRPGRDDYSSFYLRNGSNQYHTLQYKDGAQVKAIAKNTHTYYSAYSAIVAYINGEYFGLYEIREKLNADFLKENYDMDNDSLDLLTLSYYKGSVLEALEGSVDGFWDDYAFFESLSPHSDNYLDQVSTILDIDNYTDYIIAQSWIGNIDWPYNNIRVFRNKSTYYKWQFAVQDVEWAMQPNGWIGSSYNWLNYMENRYDNMPYIGYWKGLMKNEEYKVHWINRCADLMNTNYHFSIVGPIEEEIYAYQLPEMPAEFAKWGNSDIGSYISNHEILSSELEIRSYYVRQHMQSHYSLNSQVTVSLDVQPAGAGKILISTITPEDYPWSGIYFSDNPVKITAIPNPGYTFKNWNNNSYIIDPKNPECFADLTGSAASFKANFEARHEDFENITITEIHYKDGEHENSSDWVELYNTGSSTVHLSGCYMTDIDPSHVYQFDSTAQIEADSRLVVAQDIDNFSINHPEVNNYTGPFGFGLGRTDDAVKLYDYNDQLIFEVNYSDLSPWPLADDETGRTLELVEGAANLNDPSSWFAGCIGGSPGVSFEPCPIDTIPIDTIPIDTIPTDTIPIDTIPTDTTHLNYIQPTLTMNHIHVYPNPVTDVANIEVRLKETYFDCSVRVFDALGSEVYKLDLASLPQGASSFSLDLSNSPPGVLIIIFHIGEVIEQRRIVRLE